MSDATAYRSFFLRAPKPAMVRAVLPDNVTHDFEVSDQEPNFMGLAKTFESLEPIRAECYDAQGVLIRAEKPANQPKRDAKLPGILTTDVEAARLMMFADLLAKAYENTTQVAFEKLLDVVRLVTDERTEKAKANDALQKAYIAKLQELVQIKAAALEEGEAAEEDDFLGDIAKAFGFGARSGRKQQVEPEPEPDPEVEESE